MIGPLLVVASWLLLRFEGRDLSVLGFNAPLLRAKQFAWGVLIAGSVVAVQQLAMSVSAGVDWRLDAEADVARIVQGLRLNVNSVLYEELVFRGYLLFQAVRWLGARGGVLLGAVAFGVYHWFSYGIFGSPIPMAYVFVLTGGFGLMLGLAYVKTRSIAAPIGIHLGWNAVAYLVFSGGPFGAGLLVPEHGAPTIEVPGMLGLALGLGLPLAFVIATCTYLLRGDVDDGVDVPRDSPSQRPTAP